MRTHLEDYDSDPTCGELLGPQVEGINLSICSNPDHLHLTISEKISDRTLAYCDKIIMWWEVVPLRLGIDNAINEYMIQREMIDLPVYRIYDKDGHRDVSLEYFMTHYLDEDMR